VPGVGAGAFSEVGRGDVFAARAGDTGDVDAVVLVVGMEGEAEGPE
jgi:hypothetical protein